MSTSDTLRQFFENDDGSLPEVEISFENFNDTVHVFEYLCSLGSRDVTAGGGNLWSIADQVSIPFPGAVAASMVVAGVVTSFHVVLGGVTYAGIELPNLGVFFTPACIVIDYRMGNDWSSEKIQTFITLLSKFSSMGGTVSVPWWYSEGERAFNHALKEAQKHSAVANPAFKRDALKRAP
ncbi:MAG: hypothetical protein WC236_10825 [Gallionellaceae bacterium]|jgi:hypothetical protein